MLMILNRDTTGFGFVAKIVAGLLLACVASAQMIESFPRTSQWGMDRPFASMSTRQLWRELDIWYKYSRRLELAEPDPENDVAIHGGWLGTIGLTSGNVLDIVSQLQKKGESPDKVKGKLRKLVQVAGVPKSKSVGRVLATYGVVPETRDLSSSPGTRGAK